MPVACGDLRGAGAHTIRTWAGAASERAPSSSRFSWRCAPSRPTRSVPRWPRPVLRAGSQPDSRHLRRRVQLLPHHVLVGVRRRRRQLVGRLPARRRQPFDPVLGADEGENQPRPIRRAEPRRHQPHRSGALRVPVRDDDRSGRGDDHSGRGGEAPRVSAEGRLPVGRRLLGIVRLGVLGLGVQQGPAAERVQDLRAAEGPSALPPAVSDRQGAADRVDQLLGRHRIDTPNAAATAPCRTRWASPTSTAG